jgi:hypothetical protein
MPETVEKVRIKTCFYDILVFGNNIFPGAIAGIIKKFTGSDYSVSMPDNGWRKAAGRVRLKK